MIPCKYSFDDRNPPPGRNDGSYRMNWYRGVIVGYVQGCVLVGDTAGELHELPVGQVTVFPDDVAKAMRGE